MQKKFNEKIEQCFAKNENVDMSNLVSKLIFVKYKRKGNIRDYIMKMSNFLSKLLWHNAILL